MQFLRKLLRWWKVVPEWLHSVVCHPMMAVHVPLLVLSTGVFVWHALSPPPTAVEREGPWGAAAVWMDTLVAPGVTGASILIVLTMLAMHLIRQPCTPQLGVMWYATLMVLWLLLLGMRVTLSLTAGRRHRNEGANQRRSGEVPAAHASLTRIGSERIAEISLLALLAVYACGYVVGTALQAREVAHAHRLQLDMQLRRDRARRNLERRVRRYRERDAPHTTSHRHLSLLAATHFSLDECTEKKVSQDSSPHQMLRYTNELSGEQFLKDSLHKSFQIEEVHVTHPKLSEIPEIDLLQKHPPEHQTLVRNKRTHEEEEEECVLFRVACEEYVHGRLHAKDIPLAQLQSLAVVRQTVSPLPLQKNPTGVSPHPRPDTIKKSCITPQLHSTPSKSPTVSLESKPDFASHHPILSQSSESSTEALQTPQTLSETPSSYESQPSKESFSSPTPIRGHGNWDKCDDHAVTQESSQPPLAQTVKFSDSRQPPETSEVLSAPTMPTAPRVPNPGTSRHLDAPADPAKYNAHL